MILSKISVYTVVLFFLANSAVAQDFKLPKIAAEDLEAAIYPLDSAAPAVFLYKVRETYFDYTEEDGWSIITDVRERIKILDKEGLDYATKKIPVFKRDSENELLDKVEGITYNLEKGKITKTKLDEDILYKKNINEHWDEFAFTMPAARVGSVIEWSYRLVSPFWKIDDLILQEDIPVAHYFSRIRNPEMFGFRIIKKGSFKIEPRSSVERRNLNFTYGGYGGYGTTTMRSNSANLSFPEIISEYEKEDIPALKTEPFVNNVNNYRYSVIYELVSTEFNEGNVKNYATDWAEVAKSIFKSKNFGKQLQDPHFLRSNADMLKQKYPDKNERMEQAFNLIKARMTWNGDYSKYTDKGLSRAYKDGTGNVAEVNLLLVALLRECGLEANPVLVSTRSNGIPSFPTLEGFNYVIAGLRVSGKNILMDATDKLSTPNVLPSRVYNWKGRMISAVGASQEVDLYDGLFADEYITLVAEIDEDGVLAGHVKKRYKGNEALNYRTKYNSVSKEEMIARTTEELAIDKITDFQVENVFSFNEPIVESFSFKSGKSLDRIGDNTYFSPMLFLRLNENPFKSTERNFPVNFIHPFSATKTVTIKIPENHKILSLPKSINIALPNKIGTFIYSVREQDGMVQAISRFFINEPNISSGDYFSLRKFYELRVEGENEKIVLKKG
ncbi:hypothetical protein RM545_01685 [Zunongwangia sp. F260]|uniref:DUF3857 domain-containing protein n=1 Tax=Autumnicola lenta TaxID=3075593 RepID=A0ABU3CGG5_9FLAO|nr:hypothetical protein [Zunongwangia sp. F260]MDT0645386.1 hypothetical protein [Zunongwangia sp. F260]